LAKTVSSPVPEEGSSTRSVGVSAAARLATYIDFFTAKASFLTVTMRLVPHQSVRGVTARFVQNRTLSPGDFSFRNPLSKSSFKIAAKGNRDLHAR
jgi:hypothetical protein